MAATMTASDSEHDPSTVIVRAQELLWRDEDLERTARGPKRGFSVDQIVDTAIAIADSEGMEAVSMRRVARELGAGTMSLYRYIPGKDELLTLMLDRVSAPGEHADTVEGKTWREVVESVARHTWQLYTAHPWLIRVNWARPTIGPHSLAGLEYFVAGLAETELNDAEKIMVLSAVDGYTVGSVRSYLLYASAAEETGVSEEQFWEIQVPYLEQAMQSGRYPAAAALTEEAFSAGWEETFEFGLAMLLDGLEAFLARRSEECRRRSPGGSGYR